MWITGGLLWCFYQLFWQHLFTAEDPLVSKWWNKLIYILHGLSTFSAIVGNFECFLSLNLLSFMLFPSKRYLICDFSFIEVVISLSFCLSLLYKPYFVIWCISWEIAKYAASSVEQMQYLCQNMLACFTVQVHLRWTGECIQNKTMIIYERSKPRLSDINKLALYEYLLMV